LPHPIIYSPRARRIMRDMSARDRSTILSKVEEQLLYQPESATRQRKQMRPNRLGLRWELRIGDIRVFYNVADEVVNIVLIGKKIGNEVYVEGEKLEL
jgi:mRNA-degrading endonuclease RelE of RelBE toxin-antitoxin system